MTGFHSASEYTKTCLVMLVLLCLSLAVSYGSPYWTTAYNGHAGLWHGCTWGNCYQRWDYWTSTWIKTTQAFMTLSIIFVFFATVSLMAYVFHRYFDADRRMVANSMVLTFATGFSSMLGVLVWATNEHYGNGEVLNWAFALACASSLTSFVAGFFLLMELRSPVK